MAKPQQAELRRSGAVPALDPDATASELEAHERPGTSGHTGPVPEEQQPGHHPEQEQDKPDLDKFAARLGIVPDDEEPPTAPHVEEDSTVTRLEDAPSNRAKPKAEPKVTSTPAPAARTWSPIGLVLVGPVTGVLVARGVVRALKRMRP
jgi:hypothetical protein